MNDPRIDAVQAWLQREDGRLGDIFGLWTQGKRDDGWVADRLVTEGHLAALIEDAAPQPDTAASDGLTGCPKCGKVQEPVTVCEHCGHRWHSATFDALMDAMDRRDGYALAPTPPDALREAAQRVLDAEYVRDAGIPMNQEELRYAWAEYQEAIDALRAALATEETDRE